MIRNPAFAVMYIFLLAGCSMYNRIQIKEKEGVRTMTLIQSPGVNLLNEKDVLAGNARVKVTVHYLYSQKDKELPLITLALKAAETAEELPDSLFTISLEEENIRLFPLEGQYIIPENLWVPLIHSKTIHYKLIRSNQEVLVHLNTKERDKLVEFLNKAINHRDAIFPAIPEGQKKW